MTRRQDQIAELERKLDKPGLSFMERRLAIRAVLSHMEMEARQEGYSEGSHDVWDELRHAEQIDAATVRQPDREGHVVYREGDHIKPLPGLCHCSRNHAHDVIVPGVSVYAGVAHCRECGSGPFGCPGLTTEDVAAAFRGEHGDGVAAGTEASDGV